MSDGDILLDFLARETVEIKSVENNHSLIVFGHERDKVYRIINNKNNYILYEGGDIRYALQALLGVQQTDK